MIINIQQMTTLTGSVSMQLAEVKMEGNKSSVKATHGTVTQQPACNREMEEHDSERSHLIGA